MKDLHLRLLALSLTVCGISLFLYKVLYLGFPLVPETKSFVWDVEAKIEALAHRDPVKINLFVPARSRHFAIVRENFISRGFGIRTLSRGAIEWLPGPYAGLKGNRSSITEPWSGRSKSER